MDGNKMFAFIISLVILLYIFAFYSVLVSINGIMKLPRTYEFNYE